MWLHKVHNGAVVPNLVAVLSTAKIIKVFWVYVTISGAVGNNRLCRFNVGPSYWSEFADRWPDNTRAGK